MCRLISKKKNSLQSDVVTHTHMLMNFQKKKQTNNNGIVSNFFTVNDDDDYITHYTLHFNQ